MGKIINCKECGQRYDSSIPRCPNCFLRTPVSPLKIAAIIGGVLSVAGIIVALLFMFPDPDYDNQSSSSTVSLGGEVSSEASSSEKENTVTSKQENSSITDYSSTTSSIGNQEPLDDSKDKAVSGFSDGKVYITYPYWLMKVADPNFTYTVSQYENTNLGYIDVKRNEDGSATYTVGSYNDYIKGCLVFSSQIKLSCMEIRQSNPQVTSIEYNDTFSEVKMYTTSTTIDEVEASCASLGFALGTQITTYQYMNIDVPLDCQIKFYSPDGTHLGSYVFPDAAHTYYLKKYEE